jgi:release factor glutamine methyltransferase
MKTVAGILKQAVSQLASTSDTPELDAQVMLADILDKSRTWIVAHPEAQLTQSQLASTKKAITRLKGGEPLPYVLGHREFFGLDLEITSDVLIPRPETELLVERAIRWLKASPARRTVADVGTGSGCISIAIAKNIPDVKVTATDISRSVLEIADRNARKHNVLKRIDFIQCDLLPPHPHSLPTDLQFDLICANLPYIPTETLQGLQVYEHEPSLALDGGPDGLNLVRRLLSVSPSWLAPKGMILLEIDASQGMPAVALAYDIFDNAEIHLHQDLAGHDRLLSIEFLA